MFFFMSVFLNSSVIVLVSRPQYVKVAHFDFCVHVGGLIYHDGPRKKWAMENYSTLVLKYFYLCLRT
jgi:hypothetical protein